MKFNGSKFREVMNVYGVTAEELSKKIKVSENDIFLFQNGLKEPDFLAVSKMCSLFYVKPQFFHTESFIKKTCYIQNFNF